MRSPTRPGTAAFGAVAVAVAVLVLTTGCTSTRRSPPLEPTAGRPGAHPAPPPEVSVEAPRDPGAAVADRLTARARALLSIPYSYSGNDPRGFDCSGFTEYVFASQGLALPRTAAQQAMVGRWVAPDELRQGDLVFFGELRGKPFHVGLVSSAVGEPLRMIHASTSRGVIETEILTSTYWLGRLLFGRRPLDSR